MTHNKTYSCRYRLTRVPNTVLGELETDIKPESIKGDYLVNLPDNHECFNWKDPNDVHSTDKGMKNHLNTGSARYV